MLTQDVLNQFIDAFKPSPSEIASHPIELINLSGLSSWRAICQQIIHRDNIHGHHSTERLDTPDYIASDYEIMLYEACIK